MIDLHDEMIMNYKILVLYILKNIEIIEIRKVIWEKIFDDEDLELMNQNWYELHELYSDLEFDINDLELDSD